MIPTDRNTLLEIIKSLGEKLGSDLVVCKTFKSVYGNDLYISINFKSLVTGLETLSEIQVENRLMEIRAFFFRMQQKESKNNNFKIISRTKSGILKAEVKILKPWVV